jgi:hypothetical protein
MFAKIREQMGDLMTDDDLRALVATAMQKAFFEPRIDRSHYNTVEKPPFFVELVEKQMRAEVAKAAAQWMVENPEAVSKAITETIQKGIFGMVVSHVESKTSGPLWTLAEQLRQKGVLG